MSKPMFSLNKAKSEKGGANYNSHDLTGGKIFTLSGVSRFSWIRIKSSDEGTIFLQCNPLLSSQAVRLFVKRDLSDTLFAKQSAQVLSGDDVEVGLFDLSEGQPFVVHADSTQDFVILL